MNCKVCGKRSAKNTSISFFRFPKENSKCRDWADRCHLLDLFEKYGAIKFHKSFRICSQHFDSKDVVFDGRKNRLLQSATPQVTSLAKTPSIHEDEKNFTFKLPQNLCRLCAEENDSVTDIFGRRGRLLNLENKLKYFPQVINKHDILPLKICNECLSKVNHFYDFIINCTSAETKLRSMLDKKISNSFNQPKKLDAEFNEKVDRYSGMKGTLNEPPKIIHSPNFFPENLPQNYYDQMLMDSFISGDNGGYLSKADEDFASKDHLNDNSNFIKGEFSNNFTFEHDYSNMVSMNQLQLKTQMQAPDDQSLVPETKFCCDVCLEGFHNWEALSAHTLAHSGKWDLHRDYLNEFCDEVFCSRFQFEDASALKKEKIAYEVCDENFHEVVSLDNYSFPHRLRSSQSRRESKSKARLKRFPKYDQTKSGFIRESNQIHSQLERQRYRFWERLLKKKVRLSHENSKTEESHRCTECGKFFRSKASLRQHKSVHSEKRMHNCHECGMSFKRKDTLSNHLRIHTGERPFMCKICGFAFKQRGDCMKHEKNHSKYSDIEKVP